FDTAANQTTHISITLPTDAIATRPSQISAANAIEGFELSPKGERALFVARGDVFTAPMEKGAPRNLTDSSKAHDKWARWSSDGGHLAFTEANPNGFRSIYVWSVADGQVHRVTSDMFETTDIAWDADGNYLYYVGTREFAPLISQIEFNFATNRGQEIYALALRKDVKNPFAPES